MDWAGPTHRKWTEKGAAEREDRKTSHPKLPPLFSLLCNLLIRGGWEPGALHPRTGAGLPSRAACGERPPLPFLLPGRGAQVFLLRPLGGEGRLAATKPRPPVPPSPAPLRLVARPRGHLRAGSPVPPPVSRVPRGLPAPVLSRCLCPRVRDAALRSRFPSGSGVCMGKSLCQLCRWAKWPGERTDSGSPTPTLGRPPSSRRYSVITGKDLLFQKPWW